MSRTYRDWLNSAFRNRTNLDQAIADKNLKNIIYFRGKYLYDLKQAYKLNPTLVVPATISGLGENKNIVDLINIELANHQIQIDKAIHENKRSASIKKNTFSKEVALKMRRLSSRADQINFATNTVVVNDLKKEQSRDGLSLAGTAVKAPFMATAKVASKVGPLAITIAFLPAKVFASLLSITIDIFNGKTAEPSSYNNTIVDQFSDCLKQGIKQISKATYENVGRM